MHNLSPTKILVSIKSFNEAMLVLNKGIDIMLTVSNINIKKFSAKINLNFLNSLADKIDDNFLNIKNIIFGCYWKILKL